MKKLLPIALVSSLILMALASCSLTSANAEDGIAMATPTIVQTTIKLDVQADASSLTAVGQVIKYVHSVKNMGAAAVQGPLTVTGAICPEINSIGNMDGSFNVDEVVTCTSEYIVTQADLDRGSVTTIMIATASGINSNTVTTTVSMASPVFLSLSKTANPGTYDQVGQVITYTYVIMNNGMTNLGPGQFTVTDAGFGSPINCGEATANLAPTATLSCTANYSISQADLDAGSVSTTAIASISGLANSQPVSVTLIKSSVVSPTNSTLTSGSTIQHNVKDGEWLWQIARCYGADTAKVVQSNSQLADPADISPDTLITVPNIGSTGKIYGPPCVTTHTVQSGDTWESIALKYNANVAVLKKVNKNVFELGRVLNVPLNSAGFSQ